MVKIAKILTNRGIFPVDRPLGPGRCGLPGKIDPAEIALLNDALTVTVQGVSTVRRGWATGIPGHAAMAKKPKPAEEGAPAEGAAEGGGKSKKKLIIIVAGVLLLAGGGGAGWFFFLKKPSAEQIAAAEAAKNAKKPVSFVEMKDMLVGITGTPQQERQPIVKIKVVLEAADAKVADEIKPLLPRVEDAFQVFLRELRPSDLEGSAGMYRLKEELLRRVNVTVYPAKVDAVLFKELLVQ